jgi:hypothetical protein
MTFDVGDGSVGYAESVRPYDQASPSWVDLIRSLAAANDVGELDETTMDEILWERTAFPMGGAEIVRNQLIEIFANWKEPPDDR